MIGLWVARFSNGEPARRLTAFHLVESEIADRKVTRCGRQLGRREGTNVGTSFGPDAPHCRQCDPNPAAK